MKGKKHKKEGRAADTGSGGKGAADGSDALAAGVKQLLYLTYVAVKALCLGLLWVLKLLYKLCRQQPV